ncbi:DTW domain-containing protein [Pseudomonas sp.]|uniref:tRNA-uridine aminocarboxypropyltransferase n=1 Tax=Pseudomonas sp. TaxID=306 RepID=UPI0028A5E655|nr:DTW domain-containing protein [Pseudomonas sp.]
MSRPRCERCVRPLTHCLCALIPRLDCRHRVLLLQHPSESTHALNTARLAALGLANVQLAVGEVFAELQSWLATSDYRPVLLFPGEGALPLDTLAADDSGTPLLLVVPDATWRKARKLLYLNPVLDRLPKVTLRGGGVSRYRVRKAPAAEALSTIEAVAQGLNELEGSDRFDALLRPFEALIEGQIAAMGAETFARNHGGG